MPGPGDLFAQIQARSHQGGEGDGDESGKSKSVAGGVAKKAPAGLLAALAARQAPGAPPSVKGTKTVPSSGATTARTTSENPSIPVPPILPEGALFQFDDSLQAFWLDLETQPSPMLTPDVYGNDETDIRVPLAPCVYRMTDYTLAKKEPILLERVLLKLNVLRCLSRECDTLNHLLHHRIHPATTNGSSSSIEDDELGKVRFMELLSNCGIYQKVAELVLQRAQQAADAVAAHCRVDPAGTNNTSHSNNNKNPFRIPRVRVDGLDEFLKQVETLCPSLQQARHEIHQTQSVSFYPGLGELFCPGSKLLCYPQGMESSPLGCSVVQAWYAQDLNKATQKIKRRFVLVVEFIVSVGDELVFVAASDVYPEFHDPSRNVPLKDLTHRKLTQNNAADRFLLQRLQQRGEFYASVATHNHYLQYYPHSFFPILSSGGWNNNAVRPLSKGGRVMVDVKRGILEGHLPVRGAVGSNSGGCSADGLSDTVKEAIKLFDQSKRTGVAVPFRTCILPGIFNATTVTTKKQKLELGNLSESDSDRHHLWQSWPMLTGFSFTARVWGKLLLGMPKLLPTTSTAPAPADDDDVPPPPMGSPDRTTGMIPMIPPSSPRRQSTIKMGVEIGGLGGEGSCGNCGYIQFQEQAFDQLVLAEDKKELIRAVARNAGGGSKWNGHDESEDDNDDDDSEYDDSDDVALDVVANKGAASIFLLHGPPGCGKTLTAEAISELLKKPLYIVTAGDLGITAAEVEKTLGSVLELCQTWDALVLIDEADIFLEARNSTEIERNALVCVMLRLLEYYSGCLFLSSNRSAGSIDAAIASRITVMLGYPALDDAGRGKVWRNLIELVPPQPVDPSTGQVSERIIKNRRKASRYRVDFSDADYQNLASGYELNGRQIKNSIVLARALARERGMSLSMQILHRAVTAVAGEEATMESDY